MSIPIGRSIPIVSTALSWASSQRNLAFPPLPRTGTLRGAWPAIGLALLAAWLAFCGTEAQGDLLVATNSVWRFQKGTNEASNPVDAWRGSEFDDSRWTASAAPFYYGEAFTGGTQLSDMRNRYTCIFLRKSFQIDDPAQISLLTLRALVDDGYIAWINGYYLGRFNMRAGDFSYTGLASNRVEFTWSELKTNRPAGMLVAGANILAVQVFNNTSNSSDLVFDAQLTVTVIETNPPTVIQVTPAPGTVTQFSAVTVVFSEPVTGIAAEDLLVNDLPASRVSGSGTTYQFTIENAVPGEILVRWQPDHQIVDLAGNRFVEAQAQWHFLYVDQTPPQVALAIPPAGSKVRKLTQIEVTFTEPVAQLEAADLLVNGQPATQVTGTGAGPYVFQFAAPPTGVAQIRWALGHGICDLASPPNALADSGWNLEVDPNAIVADVMLNEFLAANVQTNSPLEVDEDGELQDWIELFNRGTNAVRMLGWALTDDPEQPGKWTFPDVTIAAGQYLLVFASGKDRKPTQSGGKLHASFKLNPYGDYLALCDNESPRQAVSAFAPKYPEQRNDYSYGLNSSKEWRYFLPPTPGAANGSSTITGVVPPPHVNVGRGFYTQPIAVTITDPLPGATLRYTVDGSQPAANTGFLYSSPLPITNTTVLRIAAFAANQLPSEVQTHTYIFPDQVRRQPNDPAGFPIGAQVMGGYPSDYEMDPEIVNDPAYGPRLPSALLSLPTMSIVMNVNDLFGAASGIYTHSESKGIAWERACSAELILTNGTSAFQVNCGIRMQGNASRTPVKTPKHPLRLLFKGAYGPAKLAYSVFPDSPVSEFDGLVMRADFNNSWLHWSGADRTRAQRVRDAWSKDTMRAMGSFAAHNRYVHLYLNGLYWGVYDLSERPDANFAARYLGGEDRDYDAVVSKPTEAIDGNLSAYNAMIGIGNFENIGQYDLIQQYLNLPQFIDYMLLNFYGANSDWGINGNWNAIRRRAPGAGFLYLPWDGEHLLEGLNDNRVSNPDVPSGLHTKLLASPEYRLAFADRVQQHCFNDGALTPASTARRYQQWIDVIDTAIIAESARWGDYRRDAHPYSSGPYELYTRNNQWWTEYQRLMQGYFPGRTAVLLSQLRAAGLYPSVAAPTLAPLGGRVAAGAPLRMTGDGAIFYTADAHDPRQYGSGSVSASARRYDDANPPTLDRTVQIQARCFVNGEWSALVTASFQIETLQPSLTISEIMYNPPGGDAYEYIELLNTGSAPLDLGGYSLEGVRCLLPPGVILAPGARLVLAADDSPAAFSHRYPSVVVAAWFEDNLSNGGERIAVVDPQGRRVVSVYYDDENGWPTAADGQGFSLENINPAGNPNDPLNWRASRAMLGTPGQANSVAVGPSVVRLNEILAAAANVTEPDWIELYNDSEEEMNLSGCRLTDSDRLHQFVFPGNPAATPGDADWVQATLIGPHAFLLVWCDTNTAAPGLHAGFALNRDGDRVALQDAGGVLIDALSFGWQLPGYSIGRAGLPEQWQLNQPTPGKPNILAQTTTGSTLAINEWMANPAPGQSDWLEIYNRDTYRPAALQGIYLGVSNQLQRMEWLSFLAPQGWARLWADEKAGPSHLDFHLPAGGGALALYDSTGILANQVTYGAQAEGVSQGCLPDGQTSLRFFPGSASPGQSNYVLDYTGPVLREILASNQSGATNAAGHAADWLELHNPSDTTYDLSGMSLGIDQAHPNEWVFPEGVSLPAQSYLLVWCDDRLPASTNASGPFNLGRALSKQGGAVCLYSRAGQPVDSVAFGPQVTDLSLGRTSAGWQLLAEPTPGAANAAPALLGSARSLRINEWMAGSPDGSDWLELFNAEEHPVALADLLLADSPAVPLGGPRRIAPLSFVAAQGFVVFKADNNWSQGPDHVGFQLDNQGEAICLFDPIGVILDTVYFGSQPSGISSGRLPDGQNAQVAFPDTPTPGGSNYRAEDRLVVNEIINHALNPDENGLEFHNVTTQDLDIGGWYLSPDETALTRYRLPTPFKIPALGYFALTDAWWYTRFTHHLAEVWNPNQARDLWLSAADAQGQITGVRLSLRVEPSEPGFSQGRHRTSTGWDFVTLERPSLGVTNGLPKIGPVVINEIHYHSTNLLVAATDQAEEFIELKNTTAQPISLYEPRTARGWQLAGGVDFVFPSNAVMSASGFLLVVNFDPQNDVALRAAFQQRYAIPAYVPIFGPFAGKLDDHGERLELRRPSAGEPDDYGEPPATWLVEAIAYSAQYPWPLYADGYGSSLQRLAAQAYGNDPANWKADAPTPGRPNDGSLEEPLTILEQPRSQQAQLDGAVTFTVVARGTTPLYYQWLHDNLPIADAVNTNLELTSIQRDMAGQYVVVVSNILETARSEAAQLTVLAPLRFESRAYLDAGSLRFNLTGSTGGQFILDYSTNLIDWIPLQTNAAPQGSGAFIIPWTAEDPPNRFYRARQSP